MKTRAMDCADYIIKKALDIEKKITNLQLQKILFVISAEYKNRFNEYPFFKEDKFEAWGYGPVIPSVYREYKTFGSSSIQSYKHKKINYETFAVEEVEFESKDVDNRLQKIIDTTLEDLLDLNVFKIIAYTHKQEFWKNNNRDRNVEYPLDEVRFQKEDENLQSLIKCNFEV